MLQEFASRDGRLMHLVLAFRLDYAALQQFRVDAAILSGIEWVHFFGTKSMNVVACGVDNRYALSELLQTVLVSLS